MSYRVINLEESPRYENAPATTPYRISTINTFFPLQSARLAPDVQFIDRMDELRNIEGALPSFVETYVPVGSLGYRCYLNSFIVLLALAGFDYAYLAGAGTLATLGPNATTAVGVNGLNSAVINVVSNAGFPAAGTINLAGALVTYTGKSADGLSFTGCGNHAATTGGEAISDVLPVGTNKWTFTKRQGASVGGIARTAQIRDVYTPHNVYLQGQGYGISNLTLSAAGEVSSDWAGLVFSRLTSDPALSPSFDAGTIPPIRRGDLYLSWLASSGTNDDFSLAIANPLLIRRTLSLPTPSKFPDTMQMGDEPVALTGSIPKAALAAADIDALLAGTTFGAKAIWNTATPIGATTYPYLLHVDMPACQYTGGQVDELGQHRRFGFQPDYKAMWSEAAGYDTKITVVNSVTGISAPF